MAAAEEACCAAAGTQQLAGDSLTCTLPFAVFSVLHGVLLWVCAMVLSWAGTGVPSFDYNTLSHKTLRAGPPACTQQDIVFLSAPPLILLRLRVLLCAVGRSGRAAA